MTDACRKLEVALTLHAASALEAPEANAVEAHLATCPRCRAAAEAAREVLGLVKLPPPSPAEAHALCDLPRTIPAALRRARRLRAVRWTVLAAAAAASVALVSQLPGRAPAPAEGAAAGGAGWEPPSVEALWDASAVLDPDAAVGADEDVNDELAGTDPGEEEP